MGKEKTYTLTLSGQELHDLIEAAMVCECQAAMQETKEETNG